MGLRWNRLVLSAALLVCSCSDGLTVSARVAQCRDTCETAKTCAKVDEYERNADCFTLCDDLDAANRDAGCYEEYDKLTSCIEHFGVCESEAHCKGMSGSYSDCIADHCSQSPESDNCGL